MKVWFASYVILLILLLIVFDSTVAQSLRHENYTDPIFPLLEGIREKIRGEKQSIIFHHEQQQTSLWEKVNQAKQLIDETNEKIQQYQQLLDQQMGMKQAFVDEYELEKQEAEKQHQQNSLLKQQVMLKLKQELELVDKVELKLRSLRQQHSSLNELCDDVSVFCESSLLCSKSHQRCKAKDLSPCQHDSQCISNKCHHSKCFSSGVLNVYHDDIRVQNINDWNNFSLAVNIGNTPFDTVSSYSPTVIKDQYLYRMWFTGVAGSTYRTIYCDSQDGKTWNNFQLALDVGASGTGYDSSRSYNPSVIKDGDVFKMWYSVHNGNTLRILYSESLNGIEWSNFTLAIDVGASGTGFDTRHSYNPSVIKDDNLYKMWYAGRDGSVARIIYCESEDGIEWKKFRLAVNKGASGTGWDSEYSQTPFVLYDGQTYSMWYSGRSGGRWRVLYSESEDGIKWTNYQRALNLGASSLGHDSYHSYHPTVIKEENKFKMWYSGNNGNNIRILFTETQ